MSQMETLSRFHATNFRFCFFAASHLKQDGHHRGSVLSKRSKTKHVRREVNTPAASPVSSERLPSIRAYLRAGGFSSTSLGCLGLIQTFFWPSVVAVYFGLALLLVDVYSERILWWIKAVIIAALCIILVFFTKDVVLLKDAVRLTYSTSSNGTVNVYASNDTNDDYKGLDVHIVLPADAFIVDHKQYSELSTCSFFPINGAAALNGEIILTLTPKNPQNTTPTQQYGNYQRVRCEVLPHHSTLTVALSPRRASMEPYTEQIHDVEVVGEYKGRFPHLPFIGKGSSP